MKRAMAKHEVKCSLMPGKRMPTRNTLKELYVDVGFTDDRAVWKEKLQRYSEEVHDEEEETAEKQKERISQNKTQCDRQFAEERRNNNTRFGAWSPDTDGRGNDQGTISFSRHGNDQGAPSREDL